MAGRKSLVDPYGRRIGNLRISLTDRCNLRCIYCTPVGGYEPLPESRHLAPDEVERIVRLAGECGIYSFRLTGGEPLLRRDIVEIVRTLKSFATTRELSITTNASRLSPLAVPLRSAGLDRVNISLDSLDPERFKSIACGSEAELERIRDGVSAAIRAGFPVKLNMVVMKGISETEITEFVRLADDQGVEVRFLEFMPLCGEGWDAERVYPIHGVREIVRRHFDLVELPRGDRTAQTFAVGGGRGKVGFIGSLSEPFCADCARLRITTDGGIRPCLFSDYEVPIAHLLRCGATDDEIVEAFRRAVANKPRGNPFVDNRFGSRPDEGREIVEGPFIRRVGG